MQQYQINSARKFLTQNLCEALLISSVSNIFYLTGFSNFSREEREAFVLITKKNQYIFTDGRYTEAVKQQVPDFTLQEISSQSPLPQLLKQIIKKENLAIIGFEENDLTFAEYQKLSKIIPSLKPINLSQLRIQKTQDEIEKIKRSCQLGDNTFAHILKQIRLNITEKELAFEIQYFIEKSGNDISFKPIVAFGAHAAIPHHQTSDAKLKRNQYVLLDFGVKVGGYCSDMTRTVFFGMPSDEEKKTYNTVLHAQEKAIDSLQLPRSGLSAKNVDRIAREYIINQGYPSIPHSLGHGIGIDVHEAPNLSPNSKDVLQQNMVFSIEPGIYLPGKIGVRIEDLAVITKTGLKILTLSSKELVVL